MTEADDEMNTSKGEAFKFKVNDDEKYNAKFP